VANEETSLNNSSLQLIYILRSLSLKGYREETVAAPPLNRTITNYNIKTIEANFADSKNNSNLPVTNVWILDNKNKRYYQVNGTLGITPISLNLKQFSSYTIMVELRNGDWGFVSPEEIDSKMFEPNETQVFKTKVLDKNLDTIGTLFKSVIP
ncbi:MAG: hypothetical protein JNL60_01815, partial [Bacteroidia bacterium]|nr:hypothetical protein [Bacteroidia bacterium]